MQIHWLVGGPKHAQYSNLLWVLLDLIPVLWHDTVLRIPFIRSRSKFADNYREPQLLGHGAASSRYLCYCFVHIVVLGLS